MKDDDGNIGGNLSLSLPNLSDKHASLLTITIPEKSKFIVRLLEA
jgi:hypothetical protein